MSTKGYFRVAIYSRDCPLQTAAALVHYQHILMATAATHTHTPNSGCFATLSIKCDIDPW